MFRKTLFWLHLVAGLLAGIAIAIMCFTGTMIAFEKEIVAWAERDARRVVPPAGNPETLPVAALLKSAQEFRADSRPTSITFAADRHAAVSVSFGRDDTVYVNPYTAEVRQPASRSAQEFMRLMTAWHRWLGFSGEQTRPAGKAVNGAANVAFFVLAGTGLYLWWPRKWSWRGVRAVAVFNLRLAGRARDFNWHNSVGLWCAPVLIILTLTAIPISYRWGTTLVYRITGTEPPAQGAGRGPSTGPAVMVRAPSPEAKPVSQSIVLAEVQRAYPDWQTITLPISGSRSAGAGGRNGGRGAAGPSSNSLRGENPAADSASKAPPRDSAALTATVRTADQWPLFSTTTVSLDPFTGMILQTDSFADQNPGRRLRSWTRFLHTGEALGVAGKFVAALACFGGLLLVWTGFALSWRRFFRRRGVPSSETETNPPVRSAAQ